MKRGNKKEVVAVNRKSKSKKYSKPGKKSKFSNKRI